MKFASAGFSDHIDLAAAATAILRIISAALKLELGQSVHTGSVEKREIGPAVIDIGAIDGPDVGSRAISIHRKRQGAAQTKSHLIGFGRGHAGLQGHELEEIAV